MSLPKKDVPLQLQAWAHTILAARAKRQGVPLKRLCEELLQREAAQEARAAQYLVAQMEASGIEPRDWERYGQRAQGFDESAFATLE